MSKTEDKKCRHNYQIAEKDILGRYILFCNKCGEVVIGRKKVSK